MCLFFFCFLKKKQTFGEILPDVKGETFSELPSIILFLLEKGCFKQKEIDDLWRAAVSGHSTEKSALFGIIQDHLSKKISGSGEFMYLWKKVESYCKKQIDEQSINLAFGFAQGFDDSNDKDERNPCAHFIAEIAFDNKSVVKLQMREIATNKLKELLKLCVFAFIFFFLQSYCIVLCQHTTYEKKIQIKKKKQAKSY